MQNITHSVCGVIPDHMLARVAEHPSEEGEHARATLEQMRELATGRAASLLEGPAAAETGAAPPRKRRHVYDAQHQLRLRGRLAMSEHKSRSPDLVVMEAYEGSGATYEFFARVFGRMSIDGKGMRLDSIVHYGTRFENAVWNGRQMVYGDGDGRIFNRFTASLDVIAHELAHGVTQYSSALGYAGQTGALNEHLSDVIGIMVRQYMLGQSAKESDWLIGAAIFGPDARGAAVRSMARPGTAYDHPVLGRDPQPWHMKDYVETTEDNGGVHINSGILNHGFYLAAMTLGGKTWEVPGRIWYTVMIERLRPEADFADFTRATVDVAGELFGHGGHVQRVIRDAWARVGLPVPLSGCAEMHTASRRRRRRAAATVPRATWHQRPAR
ncbi:MAG TPA: M4 family metallopeptidase [Thermoanaerobaculia bacterium]|nr:M4 family metallopeptidase [Thermoanaerobaculia bacterium]